MELLGFPGIKKDEDALIRARLAQFVYIGISPAVEDRAIELRRIRRVKLPDAVIAATALCHGLELLTLDSDLQSVLHSAGRHQQLPGSDSGQAAQDSDLSHGGRQPLL